MSFSSFHPVFLDNHTQTSGDVRSPSTSSTSSASSQSSPFGGGFSYTHNPSRGVGNGGMLASAQNWGAASESPASEAYPSTTSPSPHRSSPSTSLGVTYDEVASKQFEAADMSGQGRVSTNSATTTQPFPADGNYGSHHFGQQGGLGGVRSPDMGETWYDPEGADRYSAAQAFLTANPSYSAAPSMVAAASYAATPPRSFSTQSNAANQNYQSNANSASSYNALRDPFATSINTQPSPFASPAMSAHHRTSSFGSDFGSPPPNLFTSLSQQSFHEGHQQQQQPGGSWVQQRESLGGLQGLQNMRLSEGSPFVGQQQDQQLNGNVYGYPSEATSSTSSLHSQLSHHSGYHDANAAPDGSLEQLIAQQQNAQQQSDNFSSFAVNDMSMGEGTATNDKFDPSVNMLTFEQVLEQMRSGNDSQPSAPLLQHPNRSVPNFSSASPWPPSSASAESSGGSDSLQHASAAGSYQSAEALPSQPHGLATASANAPRPDAPLRNPTREDSFDKLKKYLKLDVNMAYAGPMNDSPTTSIMRKRSASDAGPMASAVTVKGRGSGGNGTGFDGEDFAQLGAKLGLDFSGLEGKTGEQLNMDGSTTVMAVQHQPMPTFGQNIQQWAHQADGHRDLHPGAGSGGAGGGSSSRSSSVSWGENNANGGVGPIRNAAFASTAGAGTPYASASARRASIVQQQAGANGTSNRGGAGWSFPNGPQGATSGGSVPQDGTSTAMQRSRSRSIQRQNHHHRIVQSEDLTGAAHARDPTQFLRYITAPDGSLAPPGAAMGSLGQSLHAAGPGFHGGLPGAQPRQIYQTSHDRHHSFGSSEGESDYGSFASSLSDLPTAAQGGSMQPPPHPRAGGAQQQIQQGQGFSPAMFQGRSSSDMQGQPSGLQPSPGNSPGISSNGATAGSPGSGGSPSAYSQTALPTYGALAPPRRGRGGNAGAGSNSSSGSVNLSPSLVNPPVQTVTTSATQAASASRRKNDAHFVCPVPGCGSHFTRQFNLRSHLRSHADERPFKCPDCDKAFARAHDAKRHHETLHLSVKKHNCEWCSRQFARLDALHRHLKPESGTCGEKQAEKDQLEGISGEAREEGAEGDLGKSESPASGSGKFSGHVM